jgi:hypothetical protein
MTELKKALREGVITGSIASVLSATVLAVCGKLERNSAAAAINGPSQWVWGRESARTRRASLRHTLVGYVIHHLASIGWATVYRQIAIGTGAQKTLGHHVLTGASMAAFAYFVDYCVAPKRLRPGFKKHLGARSIFAVYTAFGIGLTLGDLWVERRRVP